MAEIRGSTRQSLDFNHQSSITKTSFALNEGDGYGESKIGTSFYEIDLEGLRSYKENGAYSGLYAIGAVTS